MTGSALATAALFSVILADNDAFVASGGTFQLICLAIYAMNGPSKRFKSEAVDRLSRRYGARGTYNFEKSKTLDMMFEHSHDIAYREFFR